MVVVLKVSRWHSVNEPLIASNLWGLSNVSAVRAATPKSLGASDSGRDIYNKKERGGEVEVLLLLLHSGNDRIHCLFPFIKSIIYSPTASVATLQRGSSASAARKCS